MELELKARKVIKIITILIAMMIIMTTKTKVMIMITNWNEKYNGDNVLILS